MSRGIRRRNTILLVIFLIILVPIAYVVLDYLIKEPTCFDGKLNGDETGVDCGGSCDLKCDLDVIDPIVRWQRFFEVSPGVYNVIAYVENPNPDAGVVNAPYIFKLYDIDGVLLQERRGSTKIRPKEIVPIFENTLLTGKLEPNRALFEFTEDLTFSKIPVQQPVVLVKDENIQNSLEQPKITADLQNLEILPVTDITVVVIVYDERENAIASSSTVIDRLSKNETRRVTFTWPEPFQDEVSRFEIIPIYDNPEI